MLVHQLHSTTASITTPVLNDSTLETFDKTIQTIGSATTLSPLIAVLAGIRETIWKI